jgi:methionine-R-sulfoxide reductase
MIRLSIIILIAFTAVLWVASYAFAQDTGSSVPPPSAMSGAYKKPSNADLKRLLTPLQFRVTQQDGTEMAFHNEYWNNHAEGIYVDVVSGEPLFSSTDKFESGTGWPSFTKPLVPGNIVTHTDTSFGMVRTWVMSSRTDLHRPAFATA